jgi:hypothetical protein
MGDEKGDMVVDVDIDDLWSHSPAVHRVWVEQEGFILKHHVRHWLEKGLLEGDSYQEPGLEGVDHDWHVRRIAWLVKNGWSDPVEVTISANTRRGLDVLDGNHRLAAAIYMGHETIKVIVCGEIADAPQHLPSLRRLGQRCSCVRCNAPRWLMSLGEGTRESLLKARCLECGAEVAPASLI